MSLEETLEAIVRKVVREEMARLGSGDIELLTAAQVAKALNKDRHAVYELRREGKLKAVVFGEKSYRFPREEVNRFIREQGA